MTPNMDKPVRLLIFGRQGAGKGTQCLRLAEHFGVVHFSTGDALRQAVAAGSTLGREISSVIGSGSLVDDDLMIRLIIERLNEADVIENGYVLDGYPRTVAQAKALCSAIECGDIRGGPLDCVVHLDVPLEEVNTRMMVRGRDDDTREVIASRLALYERETVPAINWFGERDLLLTVDGLGDQAVVTKRLLEAVEVAVADTKLDLNG